MSWLFVYLATFTSVFALGIQSQNVNQGHYWSAALTSVVISTGTLEIFKYLPQPTFADRLGYYAGGITGIVASMWFHRTVKDWWKARQSRLAAERTEARIEACARRSDVH